MVEKVFGAINAPGSQVRIRDSISSPTAASFGWTAYTGLTQRGPVGKATVCFANDYRTIFGNLIDDGQLPLGLEHHFKYSGGNGGVIVCRVTDGTENPSEATLYARKVKNTPLGKLKAKDGGRWGGHSKKHASDFSVSGDLTETTLTTGVVTWKKDEWKGAKLEFDGIAGKSYVVVSNTTAGVLTVYADSKMKTDYGVSSSKKFYLTLDSGANGLTYKVIPNNDQPKYFTLNVYLDNAIVKVFENISFDIADKKYWASVINDDASNYYVEAVDTWTGGREDESIRPANYFSEYTKSTDLTALTVKPKLFNYTINSIAGNPTLALTCNSVTETQVITLTYSSATAFIATSDKFGTLGPGTNGVAFTPVTVNKWVPAFTVTSGGSPLVAADTVAIYVNPLKLNALKDHEIYPDVTGNKRLFYKVQSNTFEIITIYPGFDMAADLSGAGATPQIAISCTNALELGRDGHANVVDADYTKHADINTSTFNKFYNENYGIIKFATPGVYSATVQKAFIDFTYSKGYSYYGEVDISKNTETSIEAFVVDSVGRQDGYIMHVPSQVYIADPKSNAKLKLVSLNPMILGFEAAYSNNKKGYTSPAAGISFALNDIVKLPLNKELDQEYLYPRGINCIKKVGGRYVVWGNKTTSSVEENKSASVYIQMMHWTHYLRENYLGFIFKPNNLVTYSALLSELTNYFFIQYKSKHLDDAYSFSDAAIIVIDATNNNAITKGSGETHVYIEVAVTNAIEKLIFSLGKKGVKVGT
jgi:hypothetical protein